MAKKTGRPFTKIDKEQLEKLMGYRPSSYDVGAFFKCDRNTINNFIKAEYSMTFKEFRQTHMSKTKLTLVQTALHRAIEGKNNDMLKFCLINIAGWTTGIGNKHEFDDEDIIEDLEWVD